MYMTIFCYHNLCMNIDFVFILFMSIFNILGLEEYHTFGCSLELCMLNRGEQIREGVKKEIDDFY